MFPVTPEQVTYFLIYYCNVRHQPIPGKTRTPPVEDLRKNKQTHTQTKTHIPC